MSTASPWELQPLQSGAAATPLHPHASQDDELDGPAPAAAAEPALADGAQASQRGALPLPAMSADAATDSEQRSQAAPEQQAAREQHVLGAVESRAASTLPAQQPAERVSGNGSASPPAAAATAAAVAAAAAAAAAVTVALAQRGRPAAESQPPRRAAPVNQEISRQAHGSKPRAKQQEHDMLRDGICEADVHLHVGEVRARMCLLHAPLFSLTRTHIPECKVHLRM